MKKICTIRDRAGQREHMWSARRIEEEVAACPGRAIAGYFSEYLPKDAPILEAGCGLGAWVVYLSERGYDVSGIDNDPHVIERLKEWRPSLKVGCGDIRKLPYGDNTLGAVISLGVVEHFEEGCRDAMVEAHRVLRPGGLLFFTVPMNNLFRRAFAHPVRSLYLEWRKARGDSVHFAEYRFSKKEAEALLREYGFEPILTTWDDFSEKDMSLGIWADFPPLQAQRLYALKPAGKLAAFFLNSFSRWIACSGIFCLARKSPVPKISIVTPSFNQASFLEETIRSVVYQGYPNLEYIVMDGGSTDGSVEIIRRHREHIAFWRSERDAGQSDALHQGFQRATGEILAYLNSDDTLEPGTLKVVGEYMATHPDVDLVYGNMNLIDAAGKRLYTAHPLLDLRILVYENPFIPQQAMFWRRELYVRVGGVNPALRFAMDYELTLKFLLGRARVGKIPKVLANFRVHPDAKSSTIRDVMHSERNEILSRLYPTDEGKLARLLKKVCYRCLRFSKEPGSFISALKSRALC